MIPVRLSVELELSDSAVGETLLVRVGEGEVGVGKGEALRTVEVSRAREDRSLGFRLFVVL